MSEKTIIHCLSEILPQLCCTWQPIPTLPAFPVEKPALLTSACPGHCGDPTRLYRRATQDHSIRSLHPPASLQLPARPRPHPGQDPLFSLDRILGQATPLGLLVTNLPLNKNSEMKWKEKELRNKKLIVQGSGSSRPSSLSVPSSLLGQPTDSETPN